MKDEVQSPQEETPNTYWRWLVESWHYPLGHNPAEKWYGAVSYTHLAVYKRQAIT